MCDADLTGKESPDLAVESRPGSVSRYPLESAVFVVDVSLRNIPPAPYAQRLLSRTNQGERARVDASFKNPTIQV